MLKLCAAFGLNNAGSNKQRFDRIVEKLRGRDHLLIVDQIHNLRFAKGDKPLYILTDLYEASGSAQLWCGTADMVAYLERQMSRQHDESLVQICSRMSPQVDLVETIRGHDGGSEALVTLKQVIEMFGRSKLRLTDSAARFLMTICNTPNSGAIRLCVQIVRYATMLGTSRGKSSIDLELLKEALRCSLSAARTDLLLDTMKVQGDAPLRAAKVG